MTEMVKIVYNACYGGFSLSDEAIKLYAELKGIPMIFVVDEKFTSFTHTYMMSEEDYDKASEEERSNFYFSGRDIPRNDPHLAQVVEILGDRANGRCAELCITEFPKGTLYRIDDYDGCESVETRDTYDWYVA